MNDGQVKRIFNETFNGFFNNRAGDGYVAF